MEVIVIEKESYKELLAQLHKLVKSAARDAIEESLSKVDPINDWISAEEAQKKLNIKKNKLIELRDLKEIESTQYGRKYLYSKKSIVAFLMRNRI